MSSFTLDFTPPASPASHSSESARVKSRKRSSPTLADSNGATPACQVVTQFTVLVDSREQAPYGFEGLKSEAGRPLAVVKKQAAIVVPKRAPGWGDYSIQGMEPAMLDRSQPGSIGEPYPIISIERKSMNDAHSTILGWGQHRENFIRELTNLNGLTFAAVVVECTEGELIANAPEYGIRTKAENAKAIARSLIHWRVRFNRVQWVFCNDRQMAEMETFRLLEFFWQENHKR
jgi:hypothetical protein